MDSLLASNEAVLAHCGLKSKCNRKLGLYSTEQEQDALSSRQGMVSLTTREAIFENGTGNCDYIVQFVYDNGDGTYDLHEDSFQLVTEHDGTTITAIMLSRVGVHMDLHL